jgi:hypothetical protein
MTKAEIGTPAAFEVLVNRLDSSPSTAEMIIQWTTGMSIANHYQGGAFMLIRALIAHFCKRGGAQHLPIGTGAELSPNRVAYVENERKKR